MSVNVPAVHWSAIDLAEVIDAADIAMRNLPRDPHFASSFAPPASPCDSDTRIRPPLKACQS